MAPAAPPAPIGVSGHINTYKSGVLIHNYVEDRAGEQFATSGRHVLGFGAPFKGASVQRTSYQPHDISEGASARVDKLGAASGLGADLITRHADFSQPRPTFFATLNQLAMPERREYGEPRVGNYMWTGGNQHDAAVPHNTSALTLTAHKRAAREAQEQRSPYDTTSRAGLMAAALSSAAQPGKQGTLRIQTEGEPSSIGRKATGAHADEVDKVYRKTGLRSRYYSGSFA